MFSNLQRKAEIDMLKDLQRHETEATDKKLKEESNKNATTSDAVSGIVEDIIPSQGERIEELITMVDEIISDIIPSIIDENYN